MTKNALIEWIEEQLKTQIDQFKSSRNYHRRASGLITVISAILSGITTFFIGISEVAGLGNFSIAALASSAILNVVTTIASIYSYRDHWLRSHHTLMRLYELQSDILYQTKKPDPLSDLKVDIFYERYSAILKDSNAKWNEERKGKGD